MLLHRDGRLHRPLDARELGQQAVAGPADRAAAVAVDHRLHEPAVADEGGVSDRLVGRHQAAVGMGIGNQKYREPPDGEPGIKSAE
jgi:hypothetical protein